MTISEGWLEAAAHELGHVAGFRAAQIAIQEVRVGRDASWVLVDHTEERAALRDPARARGYLIGILAGRSAQVRWCEERGRVPNDSSWGGDLTLVAKLRRRSLATKGLTHGELSRAADALVRVRWPWIVRNVPKLARSGRLSV